MDPVRPNEPVHGDSASPVPMADYCWRDFFLRSPSCLATHQSARCLSELRAGRRGSGLPIPTYLLTRLSLKGFNCEFKKDRAVILFADFISPPRFFHNRLFGFWLRGCSRYSLSRALVVADLRYRGSKRATWLAACPCNFRIFSTCNYRGSKREIFVVV